MEVDHSEENLNHDQGNKRLPNAFILFCKKHRSIVKEKYPNLENRNITKILGEWWTSLDPEQKDVFNNLAAELKEQTAAQKKSSAPTPQIVDGASLSTAVVLAAASPTVPCWQKQKLGGTGWTPQASVQPQQPGPAPLSRSSSGSSSPEPSPKPFESNSVEVAPKKTFKQRYLNDEKAKLVSLPAAGPESNACEALLQLAGGGYRASEQSENSTRSNSGDSSPKEQPDLTGTGAKKNSAIAGFQSLRDAVWGRVAQTILMQDKEKGNDCESTDQPINLSNQCTIRGQTIIEHIIETFLDEPVSQGPGLNNNGAGNGPETAEHIKDIIYQSLKDDIMNRAANKAPDEFKGRNISWTALPNPTKGTSSASAVVAKKPPSPPVSVSGNGLLKKDDKQSAVSVTLIPVSNKDSTPVSKTSEGPLNLSTTPPQTPVPSNPGSVAITITTSTSASKNSQEEDDEDIRRSSRSCKGRRYQEFKDAVGKKGRKSHRSGDSSDLMSEEESTLVPLNMTASSPKHNATSEQNGTHSHSDKSKFDVDKELSAIPALDLDLFQQKILNNRMAAKAAGGSSGTSPVVHKRALSATSPGDGSSLLGVKKKSRKLEQTQKLDVIVQEIN